jgi:hypothetical protein
VCSVPTGYHADVTDVVVITPPSIILFAFPGVAVPAGIASNRNCPTELYSTNKIRALPAMITPTDPLACAEGLTVKTAVCPVPIVPALVTSLNAGAEVPPLIYCELKIGLSPKVISPKAFAFPLDESLSPADRFDIEGIIKINLIGIRRK